MSCQFWVHLRQRRILNEVFQFEESMRIGFREEGDGCTKFAGSTRTTNPENQSDCIPMN